MNEQEPTHPVWITFENVDWTPDSPDEVLSSKTWHFHAAAPVPREGEIVRLSVGPPSYGFEAWRVVGVIWHFGQINRFPNATWDRIDHCEVMVSVKRAPEHDPVPVASL